MMNTPLYHKIQSVFKRDPETKYKTFLEGEWAVPEFGYLADLPWVSTEKIDGTNCRVHIDGDMFTVGGRTDNAQLHVDLVAVLQDAARRAIDNAMDGLTLYGEGYGPKVQKGGWYRDDMGFILFDVMVTDTGVFLERENVEDIAYKLGLPVVPLISQTSLNNHIAQYRAGEFEYSLEGDGSRIAEGVVLRPQTELRTRLGERIITKVKARDYEGEPA